MPVNLELKVKLGSFKLIKKKLKVINAHCDKGLTQTDTYFRTKDGLLKLRNENGSYSLIRYKRDEKSLNRFSDYQIIFIEGDKIDKFCSSLFDVEVVVKKKRELFIYNNTRIHLDKVNILGNFLELETLVLTTKKEALKRFNEILFALDLQKFESIRKSYRDLLMHRI